MTERLVINNMSPRSTEQFKQIRHEKQKLIMDAAIEVFAEKTYEGASISLISKKAGISKGLMYNYFESKEALLKEIFKSASANVWQYFDTNKDGVLTIEEFFFFIKKSIQLVKENPNYWKLYSALMLQPAVAEVLKDDFGDVGAHYSILILELLKSRNIADPEGELMLMSSMLKGAIIQYVAMPSLFPIDTFETKMINYFTQILKV